MENDIRIKDLTNTALEMASDDYIGIDGLTNGTRKIPFSGIMDSPDSRFATTNKTPRGAIAELKQIVDSHGNVISSIKNMISDEYDDSADYDVGDYCIYDNVRYCCNTEISGGETWNSAHWDVAKVDDDITEIKRSLSQKVNKGWTLFSTTVPTAGTPTPLPSEFDELLISVSFNAPNGWHSSEFLIPKELLSSTSVKHAAGWYYSASDCASFMVQLDNTEITQVSTTRGGSSITAYMQAYYR